MPELLYSEVIEVDERVVLKQKNCQLSSSCSVQTGVTGEEVSRHLSDILLIHLPNIISLWSLKCHLRQLSAALFNEPLCDIVIGHT